MAKKIELARFIEMVREQLSFAWMDAQKERIRFRAKSLELEMQVTVGKEGGGGFKVWVLEGNAKASEETVQKIKLILEPVEKNPLDPTADPEDLLMSDEGDDDASPDG